MSSTRLNEKIVANCPSNLVDYKNFDGIIIKLDNLNTIEYNDNIVTVGAGYSLIRLSLNTGV